MLNLIIADAEVETVPAEVAGHRVIRWHARQRGRRPVEIILNSGLHHAAMRKLVDGDRRGRPDIAHLCLLLALDAPLNREGLLRVYLHTRQNKVISVDPSTRLPRVLNRFEGLLEHLFLTGEAPPGKPLLRLEEATLADLVRRLQPKRTITFSDRGQRKPLAEVFAGLSKADNACILVGGFPSGDFLSDVSSISDEQVCIDPELLTAPTVVSRAIYAYEEALGITRSRLGR
ncbi:MAG: 16S rRNA methyltransferase [Candidatus Hadarchaeum sp.]|uniref:16S rRNA methyltransferase n=1 Tax=Candidatus Hadarchaeum sp. TaxID=2883567 RepID=UPI003D0B0907